MQPGGPLANTVHVQSNHHQTLTAKCGVSSSTSSLANPLTSNTVVAGRRLPPRPRPRPRPAPRPRPRPGVAAGDFLARGAWLDAESAVRLGVATFSATLPFFFNASISLKPSLILALTAVLSVMLGSSNCAMSCF
eukprot:TRINITY_DN12469_c0_g1_i2.p8 TRINITY_DN12469_c0_g1~~TRINITY_DN12469_c0_g1_i2.p8  ORF type:complete len:135 (-),score=8.67 TRINITY_DN12469_c0_g1_i2:4442-4846(-)